MKWKDLIELLRDTIAEWFNSDSFELGAAIAYYAVFSLAPILVIALAIAGMLFGQQAAQQQLAERAQQVAGPDVARALESTLTSAHMSGSGWLATLISAVVLLVGALGLFTQMQAALNRIWGVQPKPDRGLWGVIQDRFLSFVMVLVIGGLLLASLVANTILSALGSVLAVPGLTESLPLWHALQWLLSIGLLTLFFALIYKVLPDAKIAWRDVWVGALVTAVLFTAGSYVIGLYLGRSGVASAYGAAGSLVVVLLWVYYSSQVVLLGAVFTKVYANKYGRPMEPADNAVRTGCPDEQVTAGSPNLSLTAAGRH